MAELDIFNPQVSTVSKSLDGKCILVYGRSNLGKTKQATRMRNPFYLPFENGLASIPGVPFCPITKWSDFIKINKQLTDPATLEKSRSLYSTIIFDSLDAAAQYCQEFICQKYGAQSIAEGNRGYGLWSQYASEFWKQINKLISVGYCCYFIAHATQDSETGYISPKADSRSLDPVLNNADVCVYVESNGVDENGKVIKSSGYLAEQKGKFFARSRFDYLPTTKLEEFTAENLEKVITEAIEAQEKAEGIKAVTFEEQAKTKVVTKKSYDELMEEIGDLGNKMIDLGYQDDLDMIVTDNLGEGKKASELKKGQEQQIEALIYDIQSFMINNGITTDED